MSAKKFCQKCNAISPVIAPKCHNCGEKFNDNIILTNTSNSTHNERYSKAAPSRDEVCNYFMDTEIVMGLSHGQAVSHQRMIEIYKELTELKATLAEVTRERDVLRDALEFYGDEKNNTDQICCGNARQVGEEEWSCCGSPITTTINDGGFIAREALAVTTQKDTL